MLVPLFSACLLLFGDVAVGRKVEAAPVTFTMKYETEADYVDIDSRIVNGNPTEGSTYPWIASMFVGDMDTCSNNIYAMTGHMCGGSLIRGASPAVVLTAAHCLHGIETTINDFDSDFAEYSCEASVYVAIGQDRVGIDYYKPYKSYRAVDWVIHPQYNDSTFENDIAMIVFDDDVPGVQPIQLYLNDSVVCCDGNDDVTVMGYGTDSSGGNLTDTLEYVTLDYVTETSCRNNWGNQLKPGMICAFRDGKDSCQGDSGGPLILGADKEDPQVGVVSFGNGCASDDPGVYSDVAYYRNWIISTYQQLVEDNGGRANAPLGVASNATYQTTEDPNSTSAKYNRFETLVFAFLMFFAITLNFV